MDLTVPDAVRLRDFYEAVAGWTPEPLDMGGYADFVMKPAGRDEGVAGICHAHGPNADLPPVWLIYITVADLDAASARVAGLGGEVVVAARSVGPEARYAVVRDPAGAYFALYEPHRP